jgi:hypothetical protein
MKTLSILFATAFLCASLLSACDPSDAEVDATQDAQCVKWGAPRGSHDYIQCRATLAVNYHREQEANDNSAAAGVAIGMAAGAAASAGARR